MEETEYNKMLIVLTTSPFAGIKHYSAVRFAERACAVGKDVTLVCLAEGVLCVKKPSGTDPKDLSDLERRVRQIIVNGAKVLACRIPVQLLGISEADLIEGVEVTDDVFSLVVKKDVRVVWL